MPLKKSLKLTNKRTCYYKIPNITTLSSLPKLPKQPLSLAEIQDYRPQQPIINGGLQIEIPSSKITSQQRSPRGAILSPGGLVISPGPPVVPGLSLSPGALPGGLSISPGSNITISPIAQLHNIHPPPSYQAKKMFKALSWESLLEYEY